MGFYDAGSNFAAAARQGQASGSAAGAGGFDMAIETAFKEIKIVLDEGLYAPDQMLLKWHPTLRGDMNKINEARAYAFTEMNELQKKFGSNPHLLFENLLTKHSPADLGLLYGKRRFDGFMKGFKAMGQTGEDEKTENSIEVTTGLPLFTDD